METTSFVAGSISESTFPSNPVTQTLPPASMRKHGLPSTGISARIPLSASALCEAVITGVGGEGKSP